MTCEACGKPLVDCRCPRDASGRILPPGSQTARIRLERRSGGKWMTVIAGLDPAAGDLADLLKQLKHRCAAGGAVQDDAILIQGDHREAAGELLAAAGYRMKVQR